MTVRERTVFFDDSVLPQLESTFRRSLSDFAVRIAGNPAEFVNLEVGEAPAVSHLVWFDSALASDDALASAAEQLAAAAVSFPERESFSMVEVRPDSTVIQENVSRTELAVYLSRLSSGSARSERPTPTPAQRIAALDRLAVEIPKYRPRDVGALWLICEPWSLRTSELEQLLRADPEEAPARSVSGTLHRTARVVASYGWIALPVAARSLVESSAIRRRGRAHDAHDYLEGSESPTRDTRPRALMFTLFRKRARLQRRTPAASTSVSLGIATDLRLAPLGVLARETSGALAGDPFRILQLADRLRNRRRVVVRDTTAGRGEMRKLEVLWMGGDGRAVPATPWIAPPTPKELGIARLFQVMEENRIQAGAPLRLDNVLGESGSEAALCFAHPHRRPLVRISRWKATDQSISVGEPTELSSPEKPCVRVSDELDDSDFVQLETLDSSEWGVSRVGSLRQ